ncbi:MAG: phage portal protein [Mycobacterium sp.]
MSFLTRAFARTPDPPIEERDMSIADPGVLALFGGAPTLAGVSVTETTALGLSAVYRAVALIAGTCATLPLRTIQDAPGGTRTRVPSFLDMPGGPTGLTPYEWTETVLAHLLLHGNAYLAHIYGGAGQLVGLQPIHPSAVSVEQLRDGTRLYRVTLSDGKTAVFDARSMTHVPALSTDGIKGMSPIHVARNSLGVSIASERSAARLFQSGALMSAIATVDEELSEEDARAIKEGLDRRAAGEANAGQIALINRKVNIHPWSVSPEDAQWLESRAFQVEEIARWYGVPPHLLAQTEKQTSWGTGVSEQNRGFARYTLEPWTTRIQQRLSRLLPPNRKAEFDFTAFVQPDPETEIRLLIEQVNAGLITVNEARRIRNMAPLQETPSE